MIKTIINDQDNDHKDYHNRKETKNGRRSGIRKINADIASSKVENLAAAL